MQVSKAVETNCVEAIRAKVARESARAQKLGLLPIIMTVSKPYVETIDNTSYEMQTVTLTGERPALKGYTFCGTLEHVDGQVILRSLPYCTIPLSYSAALPACEHCKTNRQRNDTFILQDESGTYKQVGRNCLADFLSRTDIKGYLQVLDFYKEICEEDFWSDKTGSRKPVYPLPDFLAATSKAITAHGYVSRAKAEEQLLPSTAQIALAYYQKDNSVYRTLSNVAVRHDVEAVIAWAKSVEASSDYLHNIKAIATLGYVRKSHIGYAASMFGAYDRAHTPASTTQSNYIGAIGDKITIKMTVNSCKEITGNYGVSYLYNLTDTNGNSMVWFASKPALSVGSTVTLRATIKDHKEYQGTKQTVIIRAKVQKS